MKSSSRLSILIPLLLIALLAYVGYQYFRPQPRVIIETIPPFVPMKLSRIDKIIIEKHKRSMTVYHQQKPLKTYRVALGFSPIGPKVAAKDGKTPEGIYRITHKNAQSKFHLSLKISYPSSTDLNNAKAIGLHPGGEIMIHGLSNGFSWLGQRHVLRDWTLGCIAVSNEEIEELYPFVNVGTIVEIKP